MKIAARASMGTEARFTRGDGCVHCACVAFRLIFCHAPSSRSTSSINCITGNLKIACSGHWQWSLAPASDLPVTIDLDLTSSAKALQIQRVRSKWRPCQPAFCGHSNPSPVLSALSAHCRRQPMRLVDRSHADSLPKTLDR